MAVPPPGKGHWQRRKAPILQDPLPTAAGYYAETGTGRDSGDLLLPPSLRFTKEEGSGPVIVDPSNKTHTHQYSTGASDGQGDSYRTSPHRHVALPPPLLGEWISSFPLGTE